MMLNEVVVFLTTVVLGSVLVECVDYSELFRPVFHFTANSGWINDPCGPSFFGEQYHLFFQYNPTGNQWAAPVEWGHAVSTDMIHWEQLDNAIEAGPESYDNLSAFTGSLIVNKQIAADGVTVIEDPVILYTGVTQLPIHWTLPYVLGQENVEMATTSDGGLTWTKSSSNPLLSAPIVETPFLDGRELTGSRDPFVFRSSEFDQLFAQGAAVAEEYYYFILGTGYKSWTDHTGGGFVPLYRSKDLVSWELAQKEPLLTIANTTVVENFDFQGPYGCNWEVPNLFFANGKMVIDFGVERPAEQGPRLGAWVVGELMPQTNQDGEVYATFVPENIGYLDFGNYYAANGFIDPNTGSFTQYGWITEERDLDSSEFSEVAWSGVIGFPRQLSVLFDPNTNMPHLQIQPAPAVLEKFQAASVLTSVTGEEISTAGSGSLTEETVNKTTRYVSSAIQTVSSQSFQIHVSLNLMNGASSATAFGVSVLRSADGTEQTIVEYDHSQGTISIVRAASSAKGGFTSVTLSDWTGSFPYLQSIPPSSSAQLELDVFVDQSIIEVFANHRFANSARVYPSSSSSNQIALVQQGGAGYFDPSVWKQAQVWVFSSDTT